MRSLRLNHPAPIEQNPLVIDEVQVPEPGVGQALIQIKVCGVCHTDLHIAEGDIHPPNFPITPGHQVVGIVKAIGESVTNIQLGDRIGIPWLYETCGLCEFCLRGQENLCRSARFTGFHVDGGFAESMLAQSRFLLPIPPMISDEQAAPLLCAGIIGYRSLHQADLQPGERLGLVGFGASAHLAIQVALYWGCQVYVFTRSKIHQQYAYKLGASWVGSIEDRSPESLDRAIIFAPSGSLIPPTLEKLRPGGTLAINAVFMSDIPTIPYALIYGERTLRSITNATYKDGLEFLELATLIPIHAKVNLYPFEEANHALLDLKQSRINGEAVLVINN